MNEEQQPLIPEPAAPAPAPPREPFWGYADLCVFVGLAIPSMFLGWALVAGAAALFRFHSTTAAAILEQFLSYLFLFGALAAILRVQYGRPFWRSLGWTPTRLPLLWNMIFGFVAALAISFLGSLIHTPETSGPIMDLMQGRSAKIWMTVFGVTVAPLSEELIFRGFLQPLLARSIGAAGGIILAAIPFGLLHYWEYGDSWRYAALIALAGMAFGCMRQATGSTRAAAIMHASYNALFFIALFEQGKGLTH